MEHAQGRLQVLSSFMAFSCYAALRPAQTALVAPGVSRSQRGSLGCCTACSGGASKAVLSRLTKCSGIVVVGVGVEPTQHISC